MGFGADHGKETPIPPERVIEKALLERWPHLGTEALFMASAAYVALLETGLCDGRWLSRNEPVPPLPAIGGFG